MGVRCPMTSESSLIWSMLFGAIGVGFFVYGRRQRMLVPFLSGLALIIVPYFVDNVGAMIALCVAFMALPYFVRR
jgi:hypothetical protein